MNATEQRRHATLAQKVEQVSEDVTQVVDSIDARVFELARQVQETRRQLHELRTRSAPVDLVKQIDQLRQLDLRIVEATTSALADQIKAFRDRTLMGRLRWLLTGR